MASEAGKAGKIGYQKNLIFFLKKSLKKWLEKLEKVYLFFLREKAGKAGKSFRHRSV